MSAQSINKNKSILGQLIMSFLKGGERRKLEGSLLYKILMPYAAAIGIYGIWVGSIGVIDPLALTGIFFTGVLVIVFLNVAGTIESAQRGPTVMDFVLSGLSFTTGIYLLIHLDRFITRISLYDPLTSLDMFFAVVLVVLTFEATRRSVGMGLTLVVLVFVLYAFLGYKMPGQLWHRQMDLYRFLDQVVYSTNGIFGLPARVAATYAMLFVMFGTFLERAGGGQFFYDLGAALTGKSKGGPAKIAVVSSGLFGMISGSPVADVVTTGSITIPMMKKAGYEAEFAGAVETAASTGGSIMPPIMGSAVFIMAEITGIPYASIAFAALIPALLYYQAIYLQVHFRAINMGLGAIPSEKIPTLVSAFRRNGQFAIPLLVLIWFLAEGYTASYVAIMGSASVVVVSWFRRDTRMGLTAIYESLASTVFRLVPVAAACAAAGLVVGLLSMTGLAGKFVRLMFSVSGGNLFISLVMAAIICIILGMGMPTPSAYVLGAVLVAPALMELGLPILNSHLFIVYFAIMSAVTPPVAVAAYAAASLADANPFKIALQACKLCFVAFLIPFMYVYDSGLLMQEGILAGLYAFATAFIGVTALAGVIEKRLLLPLTPWMRVVLTGGGLGMIVPGIGSDIIGLGLIGAIAIMQFLATRRLGQEQGVQKIG